MELNKEIKHHKRTIYVEICKGGKNQRYKLINNPLFKK